MLLTNLVPALPGIIGLLLLGTIGSILLLLVMTLLCLCFIYELNIGVFNRSEPLPTGGTLRQADGTAWMAFYCLNM